MQLVRVLQQRSVHVAYLFISFSFCARAALLTSVASSLGQEVELPSSVNAAAYYHTTRRKVKDRDAASDHKLVAVVVRGVYLSLACRHCRSWWLRLRSVCFGWKQATHGNCGSSFCLKGGFQVIALLPCASERPLWCVTAMMDAVMVGA